MEVREVPLCFIALAKVLGPRANRLEAWEIPASMPISGRRGIEAPPARCLTLQESLGLAPRPWHQSVDGDLRATNGLRGVRYALQSRLGQSFEQMVGQTLRQSVTLHQLGTKL